MGILGSWPLTERATAGRYALILSVGVLAMGAAGLVLLAVTRRPPAALVPDPGTPAFRTVPQAWPVHFAIMMAFLSTEEILLALGNADRVRSGDRALQGLAVMQWSAAGALLAVAALWVATAWRGIGVQLRPSGLVDRQALGTLIVPWEALAPAYPIPGRPQARSLVLTYARPELIQRRGIVFGRCRLATQGVDAVFLGRVIGHYLAHPEHRSAIGTETEYGRVLFDCSYES